MIDYLIFYEHKVREYDSVMLLKIALEKKGYSVVVEKTARLSYLKYLIKRNRPKVIVTYSLYNNASLITQVLSVAWNVKKVVNLQWEQIISDDPEVAKKKIPSQYATKAVHVCWGEKSKQRLLDYGVKNAFNTGAIHLDFLRAKFNSFFLDREALRNKYNLPLGKMVLYISTFRVDLSNKEIDALIEKKGTEYLKFYEDMSISRKTTLKWLDIILERDPDCFVIYRPHPAENQDDEIKKRIDKGRFFVIQDESIKQWILAADQIYTWMSTSIVEVYFAEKNCHILRPLPVDKQYDTSIFLNSKCICDTNQLLSLLTGKEFSFPIDEGIIRQYYYFSSKYAFQNVVDLLEEVCTTDKYDIDCYSFRMYLSALKVIMTRMIKWSIFSMNINSKTILIRRIKKLSNWLDFFYYYQAKENYENVDETEMLTISNKIKIILDNEF